MPIFTNPFWLIADADTDTCIFTHLTEETITHAIIDCTKFDQETIYEGTTQEDWSSGAQH